MTDDRHQGLEVEAPEVQEKGKTRSRNEEFRPCRKEKNIVVKKKVYKTYMEVNLKETCFFSHQASRNN